MKVTINDAAQRLNVSRRGSYRKKGDVALRPPLRMCAAHLGAAATAGTAALDVALKPGLSSIDDAQFVGRVRFVDGKMTAVAAVARYSPEKGHLELSGTEPPPVVGTGKFSSVWMSRRAFSESETWIGTWKKNGWKTSDRKPVKNADLWLELDKLAHQHDIAWHWVKGHADTEGNHRADALANRGVDAVRGVTAPP